MNILEEVYSEEAPFKDLGFRDNDGTCCYYSCNITKSDIDFINEFCNEKNIDQLNTRIIKLDGSNYQLRICSVLNFNSA